MDRAVPNAQVTGFEPLIAGLSLPDPDDRHVLAAAVQCGAQVIVTFNLRDFPGDALAPHAIEAKHPDDFVLDALSLAPGAVVTALHEQAQSLRSPPRTSFELLQILLGVGLAKSVAKLRELLGGFDPSVRE